MTTKKHFFTLRYGNRAFVITLDVTIAVLIFLTILISINVYLSQSSVQRLSQLQLIRTGSDILTVMDYNGTLKLALKNHDENLLKKEISFLLPNYTNMKVVIIGDAPYGNLTMSTPIPSKGIVYSGSRVIDVDKTFARAQFWIWKTDTPAPAPTIHCTGTARACGTFNDQGPCETHRSCFWDDLSLICVDSPGVQECSSLTNQLDCQTQLDCSWT